MQLRNKQIFARCPEFWIWKKRFFGMQQCNRHFHILILDEDKKALFKLVSATAQQAVFYAYCQKMSPKSAFFLGATMQLAVFDIIP